jgi:hypothetical protein
MAAENSDKKSLALAFRELAGLFPFRRAPGNRLETAFWKIAPTRDRDWIGKSPRASALGHELILTSMADQEGHPTT